MTYDPNIPLPTASPATSAAPIQVNYSQFATVFSNTIAGVQYNHMAINDPNRGKHASVIFQRQVADKPITQDLAQLYAKDAPQATAGPQLQLFARIPIFLPTELDKTAATNTPMQLTYNTVNIVGPNQYQSFLPGGYLIWFGTQAAIPATVTLTPTPSTLLVAHARPTAVTGLSHSPPFAVATQILSTTQFKIISGTSPPAGAVPGVGVVFVWMAIGKA